MHITKNLILSCCVVPLSAAAYDLFDPRPTAELRELSTDRPDTTESPYTVDAGHFQLEWEALSYGHDKTDGVKTETTTFSVNLKAGLTDNTDLQLVLEPHTRVKTTVDGVADTASGMNDTELRLKINLWGNDAGDTAFGIMPFVRFATHDDAFGEDGKTEGGVILPLAFTLPHDWSSAAMLEFDAVRNDDNDGYVLEFVQSITFSHAVHGDLGGFFEFVNVSRDDSDAGNEVYFDAGLTYGVGANVQLDMGFNWGLTDQAEDARYFAGCSWRY
jgi:hypothetical protein